MYIYKTKMYLRIDLDPASETYILHLHLCI